MLRLIFFVSSLVLALAVQVPFKYYHSQEKISTEWSLDRLPHPNDTDHLVFETVYSLLQHWPNTRMRNGHNIVPGVVPKGTLLYRGANDDELPPGPDWVATDPEHAYAFCREGPPGFTSQGCWHLTLVTTRPLKVVYFDGSSAAKLPYGSMDTQDLLVWGEASSGDVISERERIDTLCRWGNSFNVDGIVRMEMDFEVMLCNFTSGVDIVSLANLVNRRSIPSMSSSFSFEVMNAGSWHNRYPGETRVQLDLTGLVSFYDTQLVPSLVPVRVDQERWDHRVGNVSTEDLAAVKAKLEAILVRPSGSSSGIEWWTLFQVIVDRFAGRLELMHDHLNSPATDPDDILDLANKIHTQLRIMLTPYILFSATPNDPSDKTDLDWTIPIYKFCATIHTEYLDSQLESMTDSETLLLKAVKGTSREICRVVTKMWAAGVYAGLDPALNTKDSPDIAEIIQVRSQWAKDLHRLMAWLDWSVWVKCRPACGSEEMCYLPTWPDGFPRWGHGPPHPTDRDRPRHPETLTSFELHAMESLAERTWSAIEPGPDEWVRPQPKCVLRVAPYGSSASTTPEIRKHD